MSLKQMTLYNSTYDGNLNEVKELLGAGADIEERNTSGWTAILCASFYGYIEIVKELLGRGADIVGNSCAKPWRRCGIQ